MISFLVQEGVLTVGALSGIFTAYLLNSLKINIIDPYTNNFLKSHNIHLYNHLQPGNNHQAYVNWEMFLKDFIIWLILMILIYLFWKFVITPCRAGGGGAGCDSNVNHSVQLIPMNLNKIGKK